MAPYSIGCNAGSALELEAKIMVEGLQYIRQQIGEIDAMIQSLCKGLYEYELLLTIPGFGPNVAAMVLAALGDPNRFDNGHQVLRLAGLDLNANRSGEKAAGAIPVISRRGKADLRYALYQAAIVASSSHPRFMAYYAKLLKGRERERGIRTKMRVKLAAKLLIIAWTLMKKGEAFDPKHIRVN